MNKLLSFLAVFRAGTAVADPAGWKRWQNALNLVVAFLIAVALLAEQMGWIAPGTTKEAADIIGGILVGLAGVNVAGTVATTKKIGLDPKTNRKPDDPDSGQLYEPPDSLPSGPIGDPKMDRADAGRRAFGVD